MTQRAQLPDGWTAQRRGCYIEHISAFKRSNNHPEHVYLHAYVDIPRLIVLDKLLKKHNAGILVGCPYDLKSLKAAGGIRMRLPELTQPVLIGVRLWHTSAASRPYVQELLKFAVYNKLGDIKRNFLAN